MPYRDETRSDDAARLLYSVEEAARRLNPGRSTVWRLIADGRLRTASVGKRRLVPATALDAFVAEAIADEA